MDRKEILHVRQSSAHQILRNRESSALQYAMRERMTELGWNQIEAVDDDPDRCAAGGVAREGFDRMIAEVCLGKVGAVAAREVSRFARNSKDRQQLVKMRHVVDTVLINQETVCALRDGKLAHNDALNPNGTAPPVEDFPAPGADLERVWFASMTDARLKKRITRTVIREVVADLDDEASEIVLLVHWVGGTHTEIRLPKRRRGQRNATPPDIVEAVRQFAGFANDDVIAGVLNPNALAIGNGNRWTRERVTALSASRERFFRVCNRTQRGQCI